MPLERLNEKSREDNCTLALFCLGISLDKSAFYPTDSTFYSQRSLTEVEKSDLATVAQEAISSHTIVSFLTTNLTASRLNFRRPTWTFITIKGISQ